MAINDIVQTIAEARVDARSLSEFVFKPAGFKVTRRLAPSINTLEYYLNLFNKTATDGAAMMNQVIINSGFVTIDSFELGATLTQRNQALRHTADGKLYRWAGNLPKVVPANSTPTSSGGLGANAWLEVSDTTLRQDIVTGDLVTDAVVKIVPVAAGAIVSNQATKNKQFLDVSDFVDFNAPDHTAGILKAVAAAKSLNKGLVCRDTRKLTISDLVDMSSIRSINFSNDILCVGSTAKIKIGGLSNTALPTHITFQSITNGTSAIRDTPPTTPLFDVCGLKGGRITVGHCNYMRLYADSANVNTSSNAYSDYIFTGAVTKLELTDSGAPTSWNNENRFYGGRLSILHIKGVGYYHNHNKFYNPTLEGDLVDLLFDRAGDNTILGVRAESVGNSLGARFSETSKNNKIILTWANSADPRSMYQNPIPVTDNGMANTVIHEATYMYDKHLIASATSKSILLANATASASINNTVNPDGEGFLPVKAVIKPSLRGFECPANRLIVATDFIAVSYGDVIVFDCDYDGAVARPYYMVYDENMKKIETDGDHIKQVSLSFTISSKNYKFGGAVSASFLNSQPAVISSKTVKYIRIFIYSVVNSYYRKIAISAMIKRTHGSEKSLNFNPTPKNLVLAGKPTQGYLSKDSIIFDTVAATNRVVTFAHRTQLTSAITDTATSITVDEISTVANGDIYGILLPSGKTSWGSVSGLTGSSFTITATGESVAAGALVVFNRWSEPPVVTPTP